MMAETEKTGGQARAGKEKEKKVGTEA